MNLITQSYIQFPNISPIAFSIFNLEIRWYSLAYIIGAILAYLYIKYLNKNSGVISNNNSKNFFDDLFFYSLLGVLVGGRLGYVLFYGFSNYLNNPLDIFKIWEGGMSFHGGLIGVIISSVYLAKKYNYSPLLITDIIAPAAPIGLFLGRIANFINAELYGKPTTLPWAVLFPNAPLPRHPSQLYEAFLEGIILFFILYFSFRRKKYLQKGYLTAIGLIYYGIFRSFIEFFREGEIYFFNIISMGQVLSSFMIILGLTLLIKVQKNHHIVSTKKI